MKALKAVVFSSLAGLFLGGNPQTAFAQGSVIIGGNLYVCQHTCVVSAGSNGQLQVSDSEYGWVILRIRYGHIPVPQAIPEPALK